MRRFALTDFVGTWSVARTIADHLGGPDGQFIGTARFEPSGDGVSYHETGSLTLGEHPAFHAERRYYWRQVGELISVFFEDGRPFHSFDPAHPTSSHWCDPDTYRVTYDLADWPVWRSTWDVSGPRKAYKMVTTYTRSGS
ncbi:MAG TPA: DUF6314 family protein [Marivita sp.]|nr:DUF6314 family protein [Marivita sp.]